LFATRLPFPMLPCASGLRVAGLPIPVRLPFTRLTFAGMSFATRLPFPMLPCAIRLPLASLIFATRLSAIERPLISGLLLSRRLAFKFLKSLVIRNRVLIGLTLLVGSPFLTRPGLRGWLIGLFFAAIIGC